jgi:hypothetical protein
MIIAQTHNQKNKIGADSHLENLNTSACLPNYSCAPPSYREHALVFTQRRRTVTPANAYFLQGRLIPIFLCLVPVISRLQAASPALIHTSRPLRQCLEYTFFHPVCILLRSA